MTGLSGVQGYDFAMDAPDHDAPRATVALGDAARAAAVARALVAEGFLVGRATDLAGAVGRTGGTRADVVVIDDGLAADAVAAVRALRGAGDPYVLVMQGVVDELHCILALSAGADDVVTGATSDREVAARCRALLRRARPAEPPGQPARAGDLVLDPAARTAEGPRGPIPLTRSEFEVLWALVEVPRAVVERAHLCRRLWGARWNGDDHALDVHVSNLRSKLARAGGPIRVVTVRGVGFRADAPG